VASAAAIVSPAVIAASPSIAAAPMLESYQNSASGPRSTPRAANRQAGAHTGGPHWPTNEGETGAATALSQNKPTVTGALRYGESTTARPEEPRSGRHCWGRPLRTQLGRFSLQRVRSERESWSAAGSTHGPTASTIVDRRARCLEGRFLQIIEIFVFYKVA
jgi:hypothetical protein